MPLFPVWLKSQSYPEETIGLIFASSYLFRFIGGIFFSSLIKRASQLLSSLRYLAWASCFTMVAISLFAENFWLLCIGIWIFSMLNAAGTPLGDALANTWQQQISLDYGRVRLIGSIAFVVGVSVFGYLTGIIGKEYISWIIAVLLLIYSIAQMTSPSILPLDPPESADQKSITFKALLKNNLTIKLLIAISLIQGSHAVYYTYSIIYWEKVGIPVEMTSLLWGLSVVAEVVFFFFSTKLFKHWQITGLLYLAAIATSLRWGLFTYAQEIWFIIIIQIMHCLTFALSHYTMIRYISTQPLSHIAKLQGLYSAIAGSASIALLTIVASKIYPISAYYAFMTMSALALFAIIFIPKQIKTTVIRQINYEG